MVLLKVKRDLVTRQKFAVDAPSVLLLARD